jgi:hypothetical protein
MSHRRVPRGGEPTFHGVPTHLHLESREFRKAVLAIVCSFFFRCIYLSQQISLDVLIWRKKLTLFGEIIHPIHDARAATRWVQKSADCPSANISLKADES